MKNSVDWKFKKQRFDPLGEIDRIGRRRVFIFNRLDLLLVDCPVEQQVNKAGFVGAKYPGNSDYQVSASRLKNKIFSQLLRFTVYVYRVGRSIFLIRRGSGAIKH